MKLFWKTEDGAIDGLLRAHLARTATPRQDCAEFDPDLTNAYVERSLTPALQSRFEAHLSECAACRSGVISLARLAQADFARPAFPVPGEGRAGRVSRLSQLLAGLSRPQWAMAATAAVVLAISVPVYLSFNRNNSNPGELAVSTASPQRQAQGALSEQQPAVGQPTSSKQLADSSTHDAAAPGRSQKPYVAEVGEKAPGEAAASNAAAETPAASTETAQKLQAKSATESVDLSQSKSETQQPSQAPAQAGGAQGFGQARGARDDADRNRQQTKDSTLAAEGKAAAADQEPTDKEKARRAEEVAPPPPAPRSESDRRSNSELRRSSATRALRDGAASESVKPAGRKVHKKEFLFMGDTWVDKEFNPDKALPSVTIIRESNVYKEVLGKRAGLKPYLTAFTGTDRAIIVYKGTVYKLIPAETK